MDGQTDSHLPKRSDGHHKVRIGFDPAQISAILSSNLSVEMNLVINIQSSMSDTYTL